MNMSNTAGPPMMATVPPCTPEKSAACSNVALDGFQRVPFGLAGSRVRAGTRPVRMNRLRLGESRWPWPECRPWTIRSARSRAAVKNFLSPSNFKASGMTLSALASMPSAETMTYPSKRNAGTVGKPAGALLRHVGDDARDRALAQRRQLRILEHGLVILWQRLHRRLRPHGHDL